MMARPLHHSALERAGFKLSNRYFNGSGDRVGTATTHHYTMTRNTLGENGALVRPITHHVFVDEYSSNPGKFDVSYQVTQGDHPFRDGDLDIMRRNKSNHIHGVSDPVGDVMKHHQAVSYALGKGQHDAPPLITVTPNNLHSLIPPDQHGIHRMQRLNSSDDEEFENIIRGNGYAGNCEMCGKAVRDMPESSFRDDKLYRIDPEEETGGEMHGPSVNICGTCSVDPDVMGSFRKPQTARRNFGWHWNDEGVPGCPECEERNWEGGEDAFRHRSAHLMD